MPGLNTKVYECHVTGVRENDRVVDIRSRSGATFKRVSYLLPWISASGSGIDVIPKTGDQCLAMETTRSKNGDSGSMVFVLGFKIPTSPNYAGLELAGRKVDLPQGSMAFRAVAEDGNEAHVILSAGGSLVMGANATCRTLYSSVDSSVIHLFNNWELIGPGGFVRWRREEGSDSVSYRAQYRLQVSEDEGSQVDIRIGGDGEDPLDVSFGPIDGNPSFRIRVDSGGEAHFEGESINITGRAAVNINAPSLTINKRPVLGQGDPI